jgi:hypothetical protein
VWVLRLCEDPGRRCSLNDLACIHYKDVVSHLCDDTHVVRNEDDRHSVPLLEVIEKVQHVRLDGHVQWSRVVDIDGAAAAGAP